MATLPLGISVGVSGASQTIASLGRVAGATRRVGAASIALGAAVGITATKLARAGVRFAESSIETGAALAQAARNGQVVSEKFRDSGLKAAEDIAARWAGARESMTAAFVNALPAVVRFVRQSIAWSRYALSVVKTFAVSLADAIARSFEAVWEKAKDVVRRAVPLLSALASGNIAGIGAAIAADKPESPTESIGAQLTKIWGEFSSWSDRTTGEYLLLLDDLSRADAEYLKTQSAVVRNTGVMVGKMADNLIGATLRSADAASESSRSTSERGLPGLMIRGTAEELSSRNQRASNEALQLQRQQLVEARKQTAALSGMSGAAITEVRFA